MTEDLRITLPASATAPRLARILVERRLRKWGYLHIISDAQLVASELITNATKAGPGRQIELVCRWDPDAIVVEVWDSSPRPPTLTPPDDLDLSEAAFDANGGRGLHIVQALATHWGHRPGAIDPVTGRPWGKWVWARLPT
jgi:anti-sigma regulatory factor (Ser/Thr protein kinase)